MHFFKKSGDDFLNRLGILVDDTNWAADVRLILLERIDAWSFRKILKSNYDSQVRTAFRYPSSVAFEWYAWRQFRRRIFAGEFDVVLRLVPMSPVLPSPFAFLLRTRIHLTPRSRVVTLLPRPDKSGNVRLMRSSLDLFALNDNF